MIRIAVDEFCARLASVDAAHCPQRFRCRGGVERIGRAQESVRVEHRAFLEVGVDAFPALPSVRFGDVGECEPGLGEFADLLVDGFGDGAERHAGSLENVVV